MSPTQSRFSPAVWVSAWAWQQWVAQQLVLCISTHSDITEKGNWTSSLPRWWKKKVQHLKNQALRGSFSKSVVTLPLILWDPYWALLYYNRQGCKKDTQRHLSPGKGPSSLWVGLSLGKSPAGAVWRQQATSPFSHVRGGLRDTTQRLKGARTGQHHTWCQCHSEQPAGTCTPWLGTALSTCSASGSQRSTVWNRCFFFPKRKQRCT